jgi:hypothetical protein
VEVTAGFSQYEGRLLGNTGVTAGQNARCTDRWGICLPLDTVGELLAKEETVMQFATELVEKATDNSL